MLRKHKKNHSSVWRMVFCMDNIYKHKQNHSELNVFKKTPSDLYLYYFIDASEGSIIINE